MSNNDYNKTAKACFEKHLYAWKNNGMDGDFDFLHEEVIYEFPYDPNEQMRRFRGKDAVVDFIRNVSKGGKNWDFQVDQYYFVKDNKTLWVEFQGSALSTQSSKPYNQQYCGLVRIADEQIVLYREYWNPDNLRKAFG